jgi:hypothetical protein
LVKGEAEKAQIEKSRCGRFLFAKARHYRVSTKRLGLCKPSVVGSNPTAGSILNCHRFRNATKSVTLAVAILAMRALEVATDWPAFSNPFNWFHLP